MPTWVAAGSSGIRSASNAMLTVPVAEYTIATPNRNSVEANRLMTT